MSRKFFSPLPIFFLCLAIIALLVRIGPAEKSLGVNVRVVYLHGAWVWASMAAMLAAALTGAGGFLLHKTRLHSWSRALGRTGLFFWITYLPISLWAMQTNWNGLFLSEPRWRIAVIFAIVGLLVQIGVTLMEDRRWASGANIGYILALLWALAHTEKVLHPPAPILNSEGYRIQLFFGVLWLMVMLAAWQIARWWQQRESN